MPDAATSCPECNRVVLDGSRYLPWCSRACKRLASNRGLIPPDIMARRQMYLETNEASRLRTQLRAVRDMLTKARLERREARVALAYAMEEVDLLRWYATGDVSAVVAAELSRRRAIGRRATDVGAKHILALGDAAKEDA